MTSDERAQRSRPRRYPAGQRLRYWFDGLMARGPGAVTAVLVLGVVVVWIVGGLVITSFDLLPEDGANVYDASWQAMRRTLSRTTFGGDTGWMRLVGFVITISGFVFASALIGLIAAAINNKLDRLRRGRSAVLEVDPFVPLGTRLDVFLDPDLSATPELPAFEHLEVAVYEIPASVESLAGFLREADHDVRVMVGYGGDVDAATADSRTLLTLLLIQRPSDETQRRRPTIAELRESRFQELAESIGADDFIVSDALASYLMAQLSENPALEPVLGDLFDVDGDVVGVHPIGRYVAAGAGLTFGQLVAAAEAHDEVAFGHLRSADGGTPPRVELNPPKSEELTLRPEDGLVVIGAR